MARTKQSLLPIGFTKAFSLGSGSDANNIRVVTSGLTDAGYITSVTGGACTVTPSGTSTDVVIQVAAGQVFPLLVRHVKDTGTTPTDIVLLWS